MARRFVIQGPQDEGQLRPQATPVDSFMTPIIQGPAMQQILDLSPLSNSFANMAQAIGQEVSTDAQQKGASTFATDPAGTVGALQDKDSRDKIAAMARKKEIPEWAIPHFYRQISELAAEGQLAKYRDALNLRTEEFTRIEDDEGNLLADPAKDADEIANEVWSEQIAGNPIFTDFYAQQVAAANRNSITDNWRSQAVIARAEKLKQWRLTQIQNKFGTLLEDLTVNEGQNSELLDREIQSAREAGMPDVQAAVARAAITRAQVIVMEARRSTDPLSRQRMFEKARAIIDTAGEVRFGKTTLEQNQELALILEGARADIEQHADHADRENSVDRRQLIEKKGFTWIDEAMVSGIEIQSLGQWFQQRAAQEKMPAEEMAIIGGMIANFQQLSTTLSGDNQKVASNLYAGILKGMTSREEIIAAITNQDVTLEQGQMLIRAYNDYESKQQALEDHDPGVNKAVEPLTTLIQSTGRSTAGVDELESRLLSIRNDLSVDLQAADKLPADQRPAAVKLALEASKKAATEATVTWAANVEKSRKTLRDQAVNPSFVASPAQIAEAEKYLSRSELSGYEELRNNFNQFEKNLQTATLEGRTTFTAIESLGQLLRQEGDMEAAPEFGAFQTELYAIGDKKYKEAMLAGFSPEEATKQAAAAMNAAALRDLRFSEQLRPYLEARKNKSLKDVDTISRLGEHVNEKLSDGLGSLFGIDNEEVEVILATMFLPPLDGRGGIKNEKIIDAYTKGLNQVRGGKGWDFSRAQAVETVLASNPNATTRVKREAGTRAAALFGVTSSEVLRGSIATGGKDGYVSFNLIDLNPMATPLFMDFALLMEAGGTYGGTSELIKTQLLDRYGEDPEVRATINSVMRAVGLDPDSEQVRTQFFEAQIAAMKARLGR